MPPAPPVLQWADRIDHFALELPRIRHPREVDHPLEVHLRADLFQTGELFDELPGHIHHVEDTLRADDQRLGNPLHPLQRTQEHAVELGGLPMALPALPRGHQLHHAIIGEDAEHDLHLRLEFILRERLEQHLFGVNVGQPSSPDGIVALRRDSPGDWLALKASVAEQLCNWICVHSWPFYRSPEGDVLARYERRNSDDSLNPTENLNYHRTTVSRHIYYLYAYGRQKIAKTFVVVTLTAVVAAA